MRYIIKGIVILLLIIFFSCSTSRLKMEADFANDLALKGLWQEALFRWQKIIKKGTDSPMLRNNIAIAYERMGKFKKAEIEYQKALKMTPGNKRIQSNYAKLKKIMNRENNEK